MGYYRLFVLCVLVEFIMAFIVLGDTCPNSQLTQVNGWNRTPGFAGRIAVGYPTRKANIDFYCKSSFYRA